MVTYNFNNDTDPSTLDAGNRIAFNDHFVKLISWYDDEFVYKYKIVDILVHMAFKE
jgi:glyceraldehyde 3-phosphate dehydrogenase